MEDIVKGIISFVLIFGIIYTVKRDSIEGKLHYSWPLLVLGILCSLIVIAVLVGTYYELQSENSGQFIALGGLFLGFGAGAIASFVEYFKVYGLYDKDTITFNSPWTGFKDENWSDLKSIKYSSGAAWYVLTFENKTKIRLSEWLSGHENLLQLLYEKGFEVE